MWWYPWKSPACLIPLESTAAAIGAGAPLTHDAHIALTPVIIFKAIRFELTCSRHSSRKRRVGGEKKKKPTSTTVLKKGKFHRKILQQMIMPLASIWAPTGLRNAGDYNRGNVIPCSNHCGRKLIIAEVSPVPIWNIWSLDYCISSLAICTLYQGKSCSNEQAQT